jgi:hypothetical protein
VLLVKDGIPARQGLRTDSQYYIYMASRKKFIESKKVCQKLYYKQFE